MKTNVRFVRILIMVILTGSLLSACKKDESSPKNIVGTWTAGTVTYTTMVGDKTLNQYLIDNLGLSSVEAQLYAAIFDQTTKQSLSGTIQIKSDGTYTSTLGGSNDTGTWSLSPDGKTLTIDSDNDSPVILNVVDLTSTKLHVTFTETDSEDLNEDGTPETLTVNADIIFNKA